MNYTPNYALTQWEKTDRIRMEDFNANNFKIDQALSLLGNCRVETGTYVGNGNATCSLTLSGTPLFLAVGCLNTADVMFLFGGSSYGVSIEGENTTTSTVQKLRVTWSGSTVTWSAQYNSATNKTVMNTGNTYRYIALYAADQT